MEKIMLDEDQWAELATKYANERKLKEAKEENRRLEDLRDTFAISALQGMIGSGIYGVNKIEDIIFISQKAYQYADEMLKARK